MLLVGDFGICLVVERSGAGARFCHLGYCLRQKVAVGGIHNLDAGFARCYFTEIWHVANHHRHIEIGGYREHSRLFHLHHYALHRF